MAEAIYQKVVEYKPVTVESSDVIRMKEAADLYGCEIPYIKWLMDSDKLPVLVRDLVAMEPRYTLRSAVEALPPYQKRGRLKPGDAQLSQVAQTKRKAIKAERAKRQIE